MKRNMNLAAQFRRDFPFCVRCWCEGAQAHHVKTLADGGPDTLANLEPLCRRCHTEWHFTAEGRIDFDDFTGTLPGSWRDLFLRNPGSEFSDPEQAFSTYQEALASAFIRGGAPAVREAKRTLIAELGVFA